MKIYQLAFLFSFILPVYGQTSAEPATQEKNVASSQASPRTTGPVGTVVVQGPLTFTGTGPNTVTSTGSLTPKNCATWDANGNIVDAGVPCNPPQIGVPSYLLSNGATASWGNIATGASGALDCATLPGVCDIVTAIVPFKASLNIWTGSNDFSAAPFLKVVTGAGIPTTGCAAATDAGKVYMRTDTMAPNASMYVCSQVAANVYSWEQPGAAALAFSALTSGTNTTANLVLGSGASLSATGSGAIAATSVPASGVSGTLAGSQLPTPTTTTLGGVEAIVAVTHKWINAISTAGVPSLSQPAATDITGLAASATTDTTNASNITSGTLNAARLPPPTASTLGGVESLAATAHQWINSISTTGAPSASQPSFTDIAGTVASTQLPPPSASALGGVESLTATAHQWINSISTSGVPSSTQPSFSDISGIVAATQLPNPSATTLGGIESAAAVTHKWINSISATGVPALSQPAFADISGTAAASQIPNPSAATLGGVESVAPVSHQWINSISTSGVPALSQPAFSDILGSVAATQLPNPSSTTLGGVESASAVNHQWINSISLTGVPALSQPAFTDISGSVAATQLPNPSPTTLGGVESAAVVTHQWINAISSSGVPALSQPAFTDISGSVAATQLPNPSATTLGGVESAAAVNHQWINSISTSGVPSLSQPGASDITGLAPSATTDTTNASNITSGTLSPALLPNPSPTTLGGIQSVAATAHQWINAISAAGVPLAAQPAFSDISGNILGSQLPAPSATSLGGVISLGPVNHQWINAISPTGVPVLSQPAAADINGLAPSAITDTTNAGNINSGTLSVARLPLIPVSSGGTGTAVPSLVAGTNVNISGVWPNQTINSTAIPNTTDVICGSLTGNGADCGFAPSSVVLVNAAQTLTNKTISFPQISGLSPGQLLFGSASGAPGQTSNLSWDGLHLGIGTAAPSQSLNVAGGNVQIGVPNDTTGRNLTIYGSASSAPTIAMIGNPGNGQVLTITGQSNSSASITSSFGLNLGFGTGSSGTSFAFNLQNNGSPVFTVYDDGTGKVGIKGGIQGTGPAPSVTVAGAGCAVSMPTGTNIAGLISVTGAGSACTITITWSAPFTYANHSLCGPLQDRTSGVMVTQAADTPTSATFNAINLTAGDTLQYGTCTGF